MDNKPVASLVDRRFGCDFTVIAIEGETAYLEMEGGDIMTLHISELQTIIDRKLVAERPGIPRGKPS